MAVIRLFATPDLDLWRQSANRLRKEFKITFRQLYMILEAMYGFNNPKDPDRYLDLPIQEIRRGIRRLKPKLKYWKTFVARRKLLEEAEDPPRTLHAKSLDMMNLDHISDKYVDGVWRQGNPTLETITEHKPLEKEEENTLWETLSTLPSSKLN